MQRPVLAKMFMRLGNTHTHTHTQKAATMATVSLMLKGGRGIELKEAPHEESRVLDLTRPTDGPKSGPSGSSGYLSSAQAFA